MLKTQASQDYPPSSNPVECQVLFMWYLSFWFLEVSEWQARLWSSFQAVVNPPHLVLSLTAVILYFILVLSTCVQSAVHCPTCFQRSSTVCQFNLRHYLFIYQAQQHVLMTSISHHLYISIMILNLILPIYVYCNEWIYTFVAAHEVICFCFVFLNPASLNLEWGMKSGVLMYFIHVHSQVHK